MGAMARPKKSEQRDTRREILDAALDQFGEGGFFGTSMRHIAKAVGVRESALYHHFPSKEAILQALLGELGPSKAQLLAAVDVPALEKQFGVAGMLRLLAERMFEEWSNPREQKFFRILLSEGPRLLAAGLFNPRVYIANARAQVTRLFSELVRIKAIRPVDPAAAALAFMGPMISLRLMHFGLPGALPDKKLIRKEAVAHVDFFMSSIK